jgi:hypothetical protein
MPAVEIEANFARGGHAPSPIAPNHRSEVVEPIPHHMQPKKAKHDRHTRQRAQSSQSSLARKGHTPGFDDRHDLCFQQRERTTTGIAAVGRMS